MDSQDEYQDPRRWQIKRHESVQGCHVRGALALERQLVEEHCEEGKYVDIQITLPSLRRIHECAASGCDVCRVFADNIPTEPISKLCFVSRIIHLERRVSFARYVDHTHRSSSRNLIVLRRNGKEIALFRLPSSLDKYGFIRDR